MRVDKFLNAVNITKRRAISEDMCRSGVVGINGVIVKASKEVKVGDIRLLVVNITYELFKTAKHSILLLACILISILALLGGVFFVSRIFDYNTTISVIINFLGGIYFIYLVLKGNKL